MLRRARHEEMVRNGRQGVGIDDGVEIKGRGRSERLRGVYLQAVVVGAGEEGQRVEWVEGEVRDAVSVGRGRFAGFGGRGVDAAVECVFCALKVPEIDRGLGTA